MAFDITYDAQYESWTLADYLDSWSFNFNNSNHGSSNTGGFNSGGLSGEEYAISGANNSYAFIAGSDTTDGLAYDINNHVLSGELDNVQFGHGLNGPSGGSFGLTDWELSIDGLDASGSGAGNDVHDIVWGLMNGDTSELEDYIVSESLLTQSEFDTAELGDLFPLPASATGVQETSDLDVALAA
ncbi:heme acquisition protein HasA [Billgrantia gudaonensis]|uniref:Heme-binding protein A (HasA) n=1 Tax=Billgrantia gudaonensis TaxID=376427 RepID=A0A1G8VT76_9GAMM|nr:heme acquisition protein HasA [Halomonas gudaonensis]SDJ68655.1 Heme-binding protein A (HasA) [Halomonas gudaonensis]